MSAFQKLWMTVWWWLWRAFWMPVHKAPTKDFDDFLELHDTPFKVQAYLWANIEYRKDTKDWQDWQPAKKTWEIGKGDCEDWAILACEALRKDMECYYLCMYTADSGHATLLVLDGAAVSYKQSSLGMPIPGTFVGVSVGTFGLVRHKGPIPRIVGDWKGYEDWTMAVLMDDSQNTIEVYHV